MYGHSMSEYPDESYVESPSIGDCTITLDEARACFVKLMQGLPLEEMQLSLEDITDLEYKFCDLLIEVVSPQYQEPQDLPF